MDPSKADKILEEWDAVASQARRPETPRRGVTVRGGSLGFSLAGAAVIVVALAVGVMWLGGRGAGGIGSVPATASPTATPVPTVSPVPTALVLVTASPEVTPAPTAVPTPTPTPVPTAGPCDPAALAARITLWEGAAGNRIATVELTNAGSSPCTIASLDRPQLVDGHGSVLIDGTKPASSGRLTVGPGDVLSTLVDDANYCGPTPVAPVTLAFVTADGGRFVATPFSPTDATVPPCNGGSGSAGDISMHPWAPR